MWRKVPPPLNIVVMLSEEYALYIVVYEKEVAKTTVINEEKRGLSGKVCSTCRSRTTLCP